MRVLKGSSMAFVVQQVVRVVPIRVRAPEWERCWDPIAQREYWFSWVTGAIEVVAPDVWETLYVPMVMPV
jgi:hypothetical protein